MDIKEELYVTIKLVLQTSLHAAPLGPNEIAQLADDITDQVLEEFEVALVDP